jgi:hypothetical protein
MGSARIVEVDEDREGVESLLVREIRSAICPFVDQRLDEALGLAVGLGPVRPSPLVASTQFGDDTGIARAMGIGPAVVGQDALDGDAALSELGRGDLKRPSRRDSRLVRDRDHDSEPAVVIDDDFDVVVAEAGSVPVRSQFSTERPMPAAIRNTTELLVVLVDESPRMAGDISNRCSRDPVDVSQSVEAAANQDSMNRRARSAK